MAKKVNLEDRGLDSCSQARGTCRHACLKACGTFSGAVMALDIPSLGSLPGQRRSPGRDGYRQIVMRAWEPRQVPESPTKVPPQKMAVSGRIKEPISGLHEPTKFTP